MNVPINGWVSIKAYCSLLICRCQCSTGISTKHKHCLRERGRRWIHRKYQLHRVIAIFTSFMIVHMISSKLLIDIDEPSTLFHFTQSHAACVSVLWDVLVSFQQWRIPLIIPYFALLYSTILASLSDAVDALKFLEVGHFRLLLFDVDDSFFCKILTYTMS